MAESDTVVQVDKLTLKAVTQINEMADEDSPAIGYDLFVRDYLPLLATPLGVDSKGRQEERDLSRWLEVCRCPTNDVRVLNQDGSVRFVVPPLVGTLHTYYAPDRASLSALSQEVTEASANSPAYGQRVLDSRLREYKPATTQEVEKVKYDPRAEAWSKILVEHGYPGLMPDTTETKAETAATAVAENVSTDSSDGLYDDDCYEDM